jgi:hypothetical protein
MVNLIANLMIHLRAKPGSNYDAVQVIFFLLQVVEYFVLIMKPNITGTFRFVQLAMSKSMTKNAVDFNPLIHPRILMFARLNYMKENLEFVCIY